jgi:hypothetical protein
MTYLYAEILRKKQLLSHILTEPKQAFLMEKQKLIKIL